jgi:hypothetical protein
MRKYLALVSALLIACLTFVPLAYALGEAEMPKEITKEEAVKKYPPPNGKSYPPGIPVATSTGGFMRSPYSSRIYDCRKLKHGALILDEGVNKVFANP